MSMSAPFDPVQPGTDDGVPAADAGTGAPAPAEGSGVGGEEPEQTDEDAPVADQERATASRTPIPAELGQDD
jgi:hypothetical protein